MRRYDDPVEVHQGMAEGPVDGLLEGERAPTWFRWRDRVWWVRAVAGHWLETGPWWAAPATRRVLGEGPGTASVTEPAAEPVTDLLAERECWRVQARPGDPGRGGAEEGVGVFDLTFDAGTGGWLLVGCLD